MKKLPQWLILLCVVIIGVSFVGVQTVMGSPIGWRRGTLDYEIWGSDQSNSRPAATTRGVSGSWIWIWNSRDLKTQLKTGKAAQPIGCDGRNQAGAGPCDLYSLFPSQLTEYTSSGATGKTLADATNFGRLHGVIVDPQNRYMNVNVFAPTAGYVGIMDAETKEAIALFRVTGTSSGRSVHMSSWNADGSAILIANLDGKVLERIDVKRDPKGKIIQATFNKSASLGVGKGLQTTDEPKVYRGNNAQGRPLLGTVSGSYNAVAFSDVTPNGICKENGCTGGVNGPLGGRPNNVIICPIVSDRNNAYITFGGGGLLVANTKTTPMSIVGEYDNQLINGAGCGGVQAANQVWLNGGAAAGAMGATQSTFTLYSLNDQAFGTQANRPNTPAPKVIIKDPGNTAMLGNTTGAMMNNTGQLPGVSTRRDSHGMTSTLSGRYIHTADRIQNMVEVVNTKSLKRTTYDLRSANGQGQGVGPCASTSIKDDPQLPTNDPAPDLMEATPDGKYLIVALRGAIPVSVDHSSQGSCPGIGIIELKENGAKGRLATILRTTNTIDTAPANAPGGYAYQGHEHTDIHGVAIRLRQPDRRRA
jgi:hypothetical protein